jgi:hypothetical protein
LATSYAENAKLQLSNSSGVPLRCNNQRIERLSRSH